MSCDILFPSYIPPLDLMFCILPYASSLHFHMHLVCTSIPISSQLSLAFLFPRGRAPPPFCCMHEQMVKKRVTVYTKIPDYAYHVKSRHVFSPSLRYIDLGRRHAFDSPMLKLVGPWDLS